MNTKLMLMSATFLLLVGGFTSMSSTAQENERPVRGWQDIREDSGGFELRCEYRALVDNNGTDMMFYTDTVSPSNLYFYSDDFTMTIMADTRNIILQPGGGFRETVRRLEQRC